MKILVVTVYNSYNYGSYLQAQCLYRKLMQYGDVYFLDCSSRKPFKVFKGKVQGIIKRRKCIKDLLVGPFFELIEWRNLIKSWKKLPCIKGDAADIIFLGSDEIWNIARKDCLYEEYWGHGLKGFKISYAPSINKARKIDFIEKKQYIKFLNEIDCISVRDTYSKDVLSEFTTKNIETVMDPTLLFSPTTNSFQINSPYIAIYVFEGSLSSREKANIIQFARANGYILVSAGQYLSWCDRSVHSIEGSPFYIYQNAEYVITNTFHGTAFAINYQKQFVTFAKNKPKVVAMLEQMGLEERSVGECDDIARIFYNPIRYEEIIKKLNIERERATRFICNSIEKMKNK